MSQKPKLVFFSDIHIGTDALARRGSRYPVAPLPPKHIGMSGPGRVVTPAA